MRGGPTLWLIAGADGVGKTTYAFRHLQAVSGSVHFVNMDEIARGLSPLDVDITRCAAARVALERIDELIEDRVSFSIETTLAGTTHLRTIDDARAHAFAVNLLYFSVAGSDVCLARRAARQRGWPQCS